MVPVITFELPLALSPTMNVWSSMKPWMKKKMREEIDELVAKFSIPMFKAYGQRRRVVVTRHSSQEPDELAVDIVGGKPILDRLVHAGILSGDSKKHLDREARWKKAPPKQGKLTVEVYAA